MKSLYRWQRPWTIGSESCVRAGYPSGLTEFVIFGQCRQWSRKNQNKKKQNKENISNTREFIVLQTQLAFFLGSWSKKAILDSCFLNQSQCEVKQKTKKQSNIKFPVNRLESWSIDNRSIRIFIRPWSARMRKCYRSVRFEKDGESHYNSLTWLFHVVQVCKSSKFSINKSFSPHNRKCDQRYLTSNSHTLLWFIIKVISVKLQKQNIYLVALNFLSLQKALR